MKTRLINHKMLSDKPHFEKIIICQLTTENWLLTNTFMSTNVSHHLCFYLFIFPTHIYHKQYKYLMISGLFIMLLWKLHFNLMLLSLFYHTFYTCCTQKLTKLTHSGVFRQASGQPQYYNFNGFLGQVINFSCLACLILVKIYILL